MRKKEQKVKFVRLGEIERGWEYEEYSEKFNYNSIFKGKDKKSLRHWRMVWNWSIFIFQASTFLCFKYHKSNTCCCCKERTTAKIIGKFKFPILFSFSFLFSSYNFISNRFPYLKVFSFNLFGTQPIRKLNRKSNHKLKSLLGKKGPA